MSEIEKRKLEKQNCGKNYGLVNNGAAAANANGGEVPESADPTGTPLR